MARAYVKHRWMWTGGKGHHSICIVCGIGSIKWEKKIENDSMLNWDCLAVRNRKTLKNHTPK